MSEPLISISYLFDFENSAVKRVEALLKSSTLSLVLPTSYEIPSWAKAFRCSQCPPKTANSRCCSICVNISHLIEEFKTFDSVTPCTISVLTKERNYTLKSDVQRGLSSLLGLYMATSDCPFLGFLRPMARFHLPFASTEETIFRSTGSYLLGQYFKAKKNNQADFELGQLPATYSKVSKINHDIIRHLHKNYYAHDAYANSLVVLDNLAQMISAFLPEELDEFASYYEQTPK
jgi:hypothetical protein